MKLIIKNNIGMLRIGVYDAYVILETNDLYMEIPIYRMMNLMKQMVHKRTLLEVKNDVCIYVTYAPEKNMLYLEKSTIYNTLKSYSCYLPINNYSDILLTIIKRIENVLVINRISSQIPEISDELEDQLKIYSVTYDKYSEFFLAGSLEGVFTSLSEFINTETTNVSIELVKVEDYEMILNELRRNKEYAEVGRF